jgi:16S rRNA (adenine1518-N6/adenine1519-N6)-dimethyltransferase
MVLMGDEPAFAWSPPQRYFRTTGRTARKRLGQHFLVQPATAQRIVLSAALQPTEVAVEVGPGLGAMTRCLVPRVAHLHLVEIDRELSDHLEAQLSAHAARVSLHRQDVLTFDFRAAAAAAGRRLVVVGNLPYQITSPLLFHMVEASEVIERAVLMVQREVGERLGATPGSKVYGLLPVIVGVHATIEELFRVAPSQFFPPPRVDSLVVRLRFRARPLVAAGDYPWFARVVGTAFQQRRKTLQNSLRPLLGAAAVKAEDFFAGIRVDPRRRPETLSLDEFIRLAAALRPAGQGRVDHRRPPSRAPRTSLADIGLDKGRVEW